MGLMTRRTGLGTALCFPIRGHFTIGRFSLPLPCSAVLPGREAGD
ncbi:hypothetical protein OCGS_1704 [Oceaniovalibus guishaninsula JLT2003]|uniref:Uncharacterized protein n=1 Tax=Oceaniovalibus guishaninsula JLT2003 TaxID=1231392 RepID=K2H9H6_9RHOB|nr:hypothetical protein OCGS_1704 [Oceaniovalibus guishaninsula JLT2003]